MKKIIIATMIACLSLNSYIHAENSVTKTAETREVSPEMKKLLNDSLTKETKPYVLSTGDWVWIGVFSVICIAAGVVTANGLKPVNR